MSLCRTCSRDGIPCPRMASEASVPPLSQAEAGPDTTESLPLPSLQAHDQRVTGVFPSPTSLAMLTPGQTFLSVFACGQHHQERGPIHHDPTHLATGLLALTMIVLTLLPPISQLICSSPDLLQSHWFHLLSQTPKVHFCLRTFALPVPFA